jgi:thioester reductase-like protein
MIPIVPSTTPIPTAEAVVDALRQTPADVLMLAPSVVADLAQSPELLDYCARHLEMIIYIGGDLPQAIGDRVAARMLLRCQWGASEVGIPHQLMPSELGPADWRYIRFHPCVGAVFEEVSEGIYELVIRRDEALAATQPTWTIRGLDSVETEYRTRDLFERHPTVSDAWRWRARADDIIVFLNGEKTNPVSMEQHVVASNPQLGGAIVIGAQRFQAALLVEPRGSADPLTTAEQAALIERVWPSVEEANRAAPAHARVEKSLILITAPDRPLIRAGKGTIQRVASVAQYQDEIEKLYADADVVLDDDVAGVQVDPTDVDGIARVIRACVRSVTGWPILGDSDNLFARGMDSLLALQLARALRRTLSRPSLALSTVYQNPTVAGLAAAMAAQEGTPNDRDATEPLLAAYRRLVHEIPTPKCVTPKKAEEPVDVILTGSTGQVGTFMLYALLGHHGIGHIFCLNRSQDGGGSVQHERFTAAGLETEGLADRVSFVQVDVARPKLGLDDATYEDLRGRAGLFIHNAWPVNFNLPLSAFQPQLAGLVNVFALAAAAPRPMRVVFVSSIGAVAGRASTDEPAPEAILASFDTPYAGGYARSKFLSEHLCDAAARHLGLSVAVVRLGQVAGAVRGPSTWSRAEWLPSLVISSLHLGYLPDGVGPLFSAVDFVPADILGDIMVDLAMAENASAAGAAVFNLRNPRPTTWGALLPAVAAAARERLGKTLEVVPPATWLTRLRESEGAATTDPEAAAAANPALKLLEFYHDVMSNGEGSAPPMAIEHALAASAMLRDLPPVELVWMRKWVDGWIK